jgi:hypothetical protein
MHWRKCLCCTPHQHVWYALSGRVRPRHLGGGADPGSPTSGAGGSGIVIIRYAAPQAFIGGTVTQVSGDVIHTFTVTGSHTLTVYPEFVPSFEASPTRYGCRDRTELTQAECLAFKNSQSSPTVLDGVSHAWGSAATFLGTASHYPPGCFFYWDSAHSDYNRIMFNIPATIDPLVSALGTSQHAIPICAPPPAGANA